MPALDRAEDTAAYVFVYLTFAWINERKQPVSKDESTEKQVTSPIHGLKLPVVIQAYLDERILHHTLLSAAH